MDVSTFFVSYSQATKLIQPSKGSVPQPSDIGPTRCHVFYCEWPVVARCGGHETLAGASPRHMHGHPTPSLDGIEAVLSRTVLAESNRQAVKLVASRDNWPPSKG
jgi:hypothetical protein